ncbi:MAG: hypothetical protein ABIQ64_03125 [Candidatus Saccharimonadales bacterium]
MTSEQLPGVGLKLHNARRLQMAQNRLKAQRQMSFIIQEAEIRRIRQHIDHIDDPQDFTTYPPDGEIPLGRATLSRLYHESQNANNQERALFAERGLHVLKERWKQVGHAATCNTGRLIVPAKSGQPWVPFTRG